MKNILLILFIIGIDIEFVSSQTLSQFNWDFDVTTPLDGPAVLSVSPSAYSDAGGASGTNGLNAGLPKKDLDFELPGNYFNVDGIDVSIDYQRDENSGQFFTRGSSFRFDMSGGKLRIKYRVYNNSVSHTEVNGTNFYTIPLDDVFRKYRFTYDPNTGEAFVFVDGIEKWSNAGNLTPGKVMFWDSGVNAFIGLNMDGNGSDKTIFDNFRVNTISFFPLPVSLTDFKIDLIDNSYVLVNWVTESEINNDYFSIEKSHDGKHFEKIESISGAGNSSSLIVYSYKDETPYLGVSYYRIMQTDFNGKSDFSKVLAIDRNTADDAMVTVYPNPCLSDCNVSIEFFNLQKKLEFELVDLLGNVVVNWEEEIEATNFVNTKIVGIDNLFSGVYLLRIKSGSINHVKKIMIGK